ncbi:Uma2 family endonuclease [Planctellipticum variicoloris]|uniref:Uma2 family endonuclease n=1 Tax=Planctellipticum variicoloris TaxID=3064265 RepID=UPI00301343AA|nr:Uma2 family endonuclease [Planctomycetaceae bacterium SH412]
MSTATPSPKTVEERAADLYRPYDGTPLSKRGEPVWELALRYPVQGDWTERDYFAADLEGLVELVDGCVEVLPMPTILHQLLVMFLAERLRQHLQGKGLVVVAPCPIRLGKDHLREPDVFYLAPGRSKDVREVPDGADLVMEVVSPGVRNQQRDRFDKRADYAAAGIAEYWIVDPEGATVTVLTLDGETYREHGVFKAGETATSVLLPGLAVDVTELWAAGQAGAVSAPR